LTKTPLFREILQIAVVVRDLDASVRIYSEEYGFGPWRYHEFKQGDVKDLVKDDRPASYGMRIAIATIGSLEWELIQPLDDNSNYAEFLRLKGEGVHHVQLAVDDYSTALAALREKGHTVVVGGTFEGTRLSYVSTDRDLGVITEILDIAPGDVASPTGAAMEES